DYGLERQDGWRTIDKVLRPEATTVTDTGQIQDFYSSKPPLLTTLMAGEYWLLKCLFGWSITENRWQVVPAILLTFNLLPFFIYLIVLLMLVVRYAVIYWCRY